MDAPVLDTVRLETFYEQMFLIRVVEENLLDLFSKGLLFGTTHTSIGQEANAVGVLSALDKSKDTVWSSHRCHGHFLAYCGNVEGLIAEIMGRTTGVCGGRGGSQHLCFNNFHSNGVQGGITPVAVGCAMAKRDEGALTTVFLGDGTMGEGLVYESLNLASLLGAPVLFVVEDNGIAQTTPKELAVSGSIVERAQPFGIETFDYDGCDVVAINELATQAVAYVRSACRPAWLYLKTARIGPHSKGDDTRSPAELDAARARDPLAALKPRVRGADHIEAKCRARVAAAIDAATSAPLARG